MPARLTASFIAFVLLTMAGPLAQASSVSGILRDNNGRFVEDAAVQLLPSEVSTITSKSGTFRIDNVKPGSYTLVISAKGFVPLTQTVSAENDPVNLSLEVKSIQTSIEVKEKFDDFLAANSVSITKTPQALIDVPYSIQVIPKALFDARQIQDVKDLYRNISGVTDAPYSAMTFRGFTQREILFNGVRGNPYGSLSSGIDDAGFSTSFGSLTNIDYVEVLKGPASVLYGAGEPGGIINFVTRKPKIDSSVEASFRTGSYRQLGGHLELSGPLVRRRNFFYRAAFYGEDRKTFRYNTKNESMHAAGGLTWNALESTSVGFEYEYIDQFMPGYRLRGIPVNNSGGWLTSREWTATEPSDSSALQARVVQGRVDHSFTPTWRMDATFRYLNSARPERYHEPRGLNADGRTMRREFRNQFRGNSDWSLTANGYGRSTTEHFGVHNILFGFESVREDWTGRYATAVDTARGGPVPPIDLFAPRYGQTNGGLYRLPPITTQTVLSRREGGFVQDQIEILPRLQIMLGGRVEHLRDNGNAGTPLNFAATGFTGRVGAVWRFLPNVSAFASVSNSFNRPPALSQAPSGNGPHSPERGNQVEVGVKSQFAGDRVLMTAALFRIKKTNILRPDPLFGPNGDNFAAVLPVGAALNQGFEFDLTGRVTKQLSMILNYAYLDSTILEDRFTPVAVGRSLPNAAKHAGGLFLRYDLPFTKTSFTVGSESRSVRYEPYAQLRAGGYAIWDAGLIQRIHPKVEFRTQLTNLSDRLYATSSLFAARIGNMPGVPRTVTFSLHFRSAGF